ncbi:MAG: hypothetical protein GTN35_05205 [Nitrososphaeria archaeon]|nr:hypothetical protein [Nitrosopumilaceae archaeon]NIP09592.1 hypothetical protein [Nitrosopumilaceae archaeon]NIP91775.1 hypothetical protein [Nitrososphaeria archaeon]NIS95834.1 hypothetical protein [Nitrosopumilaceae archaeon]
MKLQLIVSENSAKLMTKYGSQTTSLSLLAVFAIASITGLTTAFAEEEYPYSVADNIHAISTFTFKDGVEVVEFPVFIMEDDYIQKNVSPSFSVEGVVGESPYLHKALDEAFKYKQNPSYEYNFQLFDVEIDFVKDGNVLRTLNYHDCRVDDYKVKTLTDDYESYLSSKTGFAIIDDIDFICGGLNSRTDIVNDVWRQKFTTIEYSQTPYVFAEDIRTWITFEFDQGIEKIEFPYFQTNSGFEEKDNNPRFSVEGTVQEHVLLNMAIDKARQNSGMLTGVNVDFEATVEFVKGNKVLRSLEYRDCRVSGALMTTLVDKEEGFTGKSGFAYVEQIDFDCLGLDPVDSSYAAMIGDTPIWKVTKLENILENHEYPLGTGPRAIATFTYDEGVEVIDFPIFDQGKVLVKSNPTFELEGLIRDSPMLYRHIDDALALTGTTGASNALDLFQVDVELVHGDNVVRGFNYVDCRVSDYDVQTQRDKEESYFKGFALANTIYFTCEGYHPNAPLYDAMFQIYDKTSTINTTDLRETHNWDPGFYYER